MLVAHVLAHIVIAGRDITAAGDLTEIGRMDGEDGNRSDRSNRILNVFSSGDEISILYQIVDDCLVDSGVAVL